MGIFNRWTSKKENDEAKEKRAASVIKKAKEITKEDIKETKESPKKEKNTKVKVEEVVKDKPLKFNSTYKVLVRPLVTEKSTYLQSLGVYVFEVFPTANKTEVKKAIEGLYGIKVVSIRIVNLKGKKVRFGRTKGVRKDRKKAIVTLKKGQIIELHKNV